MMFKIIFAICVGIAALTSAMTPETTGDMIYVEPETVETEYIPEVTEPETIVEETTIAVVESSTASSTTLYYNVNLPTEVQDVIFAECEKYNIPPSIVIAMIERESQFIPNVVGDNGNSFGLMQIQPYWHSQRMARLGCTDLLDPIQNVTVGIDFLGELYIRYGDIGLALTAYNSGSANNGYSGYAIAVMARANEV